MIVLRSIVREMKKSSFHFRQSTNCIADGFTRNYYANRLMFPFVPCTSLFAHTLITLRAFLISLICAIRFTIFLLFDLMLFSFVRSRVAREQFNHQKNSFSPEKIQWRFNMGSSAIFIDSVKFNFFLHRFLLLIHRNFPRRVSRLRVYFSFVADSFR